MYFPYLRGRQFELLAIRELVEKDRISDKVIPIIEPVRSSTTLLKTIEAFNKRNHKIAFIINPTVGSFGSKYDSYDKIKNLSTNIQNDNVIKACLATKKIDNDILSKYNTTFDNTIFIYDNKKCLENMPDVKTLYNVIPDDRDYRRQIHGNRIVISDPFPMQNRNADYQETPEFFSSDHIYFQDDGYDGFSDYSIVGNRFSETGFAPYCLAIHIVYPNENNELMIKHFKSRSNDDISDPAGKYGEALNSLIEWNHSIKLDTLGMQMFKESYDNKTYPGLGTIKKFSIMNHLEIVSRLLK